jgi:SAM-dependent methyltransferase
MLYHVPKRPTALSEFRRILKPGGILYASTIGENHLLELNELLSRFGHGLESEYRSSSSGFLLENGIQQLKPFFERISVSRYPDSLIVTDAALLTDYILSGRNTVDSGLKEDLLQFIAHEITVDGHIHITKDSGLFIASR